MMRAWGQRLALVTVGGVALAGCGSVVSERSYADYLDIPADECPAWVSEARGYKSMWVEWQTKGERPLPERGWRDWKTSGCEIDDSAFIVDEAGGLRIGLPVPGNAQNWDDDELKCFELVDMKWLESDNRNRYRGKLRHVEIPCRQIFDKELRGISDAAIDD